MNKLLFLFLFFSQIALGSSIKVNHSESVDDYGDWNISGTWSMKDNSYWITSYQNTASGADLTTEYTVGFGADSSESNSYYWSLYFRKEPDDVKALGVSPSFTHSLEQSLIEDQDSSFTFSLPVSRYSAGPWIGTKKNPAESFYSIGFSGDFSQDLSDLWNVSIGASYQLYTSPKTTGGPGKSKKRPNQRRLNVISASDNILSSNGYPEASFYCSGTVSFFDDWSSSYSFSISIPHYTGSTSYFSSLELNRSFLKDWSAEVQYNWSSTGTETLGLALSWSKAP
jgi:hypothetical protein